MFTDIEGSTGLWEAAPAAMRTALERHDSILRSAIDGHDGYVFSTGGDGFAAAFTRAGDALQAAVDAQASLTNEAWPDSAPLRVRMGLHTGEVEEREGDYFGPAVNRAARLMAAAHGGQVVCSAVTASLAAGQLTNGADLVELGRHRLRDLSEPELVFQLAHPALRSDCPPLRSLDNYPGNLPIQLTSFVGRHVQLAELAKALAETRILTLCGVGGVGKTRLALQVAAEVVPHFADGVWLVELAAVSSAEAMEEAVASALGVPQRPGTTMQQGILDFLRDRSLLLVLDNCEHLLGAVATLTDAAVRTAAGLRVLATSREGLAVAGEQIATVPSLALPEAGSASGTAFEAEAVRLFIDRAKEADAAFLPDPDDVLTVAELCKRLDGIPLAIELAAARVKGMTPIEITGHLDRRFRLLSRGRRTASTRHQTLRNTIDWSYELLDEPERTVLRRLAVFHGGFAIAAAEEIVSDDDLDSFEVVDLVVRLVEKSLVVAEANPKGTRYRLLETVRDYAWERLEASDELDRLAEAPARHFVEFAIQAGTGLESPDELMWRSAVEQDLENLRGALRWAIDSNDADLALIEIEALNTVGSLRAPPFGMTAMEAANMPGAEGHELRAMALASVCMTLTQQGEVERALEVASAAEDAARMWGNTLRHGKLRCRLGGCLTTAIAYSGDYERLLELAQAELRQARAIDDRFETARALILLASILDANHNDEAIRLGEEGLTLARQIGNPSYVAWAPMMLAGRLATDDPIRTRQLLDEAAQAATLADNNFARSMAMQQLALIQAHQHDYLAAGQSLREMIHHARETGDHGSTLSGLGTLACVFAALGVEEPAMVIAIWVGDHGIDLAQTAANNPNWILFGIATPLTALQDEQSEATLRLFQQQADSLDEARIIAYVSDHLERLIQPEATNAPTAEH